MRSRCCVLIFVLAILAGCGGRAPDTAGPRPRVVLIGVDGATWHVMLPMMERGELPHFKALVDRGAHGNLISIEPMVSPALWTTVATGSLRARHGISGFVEGDQETGKPVPVSSNMRRTEALWTILPRQGRTVNVVGWYASWPAEVIDGRIVTDHFLPRDESAYWPVTAAEEARLGGRTHPRELLNEILPLVPTMEEVAKKDRLALRFKADGSPENPALTKLFLPHRVDETRVRVTKYLMRTYPADLTMTFIWGIDPMSHVFWQFFEPQTWTGDPIPPEVMAANKDRIPNYYRKVDAYIGELVEAAGEDAIVVIVSDHGFGPGPHKSAQGMLLSGDHAKEGILIAAGGPVRSGVRVEDTSIVNIAPTLLYLLRLPVGDDMDGRVIEALFDSPLPYPIETVPTYERPGTPQPRAPIASPIDEEIREQLRALGYLK
jgi:predicted AlkP superfamily phosphohydrolase/phosphomutase